MLNGEAAVEGSYRQHIIDKLKEDDDGYDSDDSFSNAHENVRKDAWVLFETTVDHAPSPHSVKPSQPRESRSPLALVMVLIRKTSAPSTYPVVVTTPKPLPASQPLAPL